MTETPDKPAPRKLTTKKKLIYTAVAILLPLLLIESLSRIIWFSFIYESPTDNQLVEQEFWGKSKDRPIPYLFTKNSTGKIGSSQTRINNLGLRGKDISTTPAKGTRRILCLGDSVTFGFCVTSDKETYPVLLEKLLLDKGYNVEVLNGGMPGFRSEHIRNHYFKNLIHLAPEIVIIELGWNDLVDSILLKKSTFTDTLFEFFNENIYSFKILLHISAASGIAETIDKSKNYKRPEGVINKTGFAVFLKSIVDIISVSKQKNIKPILCKLPYFYDNMNNDEAYRKAFTFRPYGTIEQIRAVVNQLNSLIEQVGQRYKIPIIDLSKINDESMFSDFCHPNDKGSKLMAAEIFKVLQNEL